MLRNVLQRTGKALIPLGAAVGIVIIFTILMDLTKNPLKISLAFFLSFLGLLGIWAVVNPKGYFMYWSRWKLLLLAKYPEPSEVAIVLTRVEGIVIVVSCIVFLIKILSS